MFAKHQQIFKDWQEENTMPVHKSPAILSAFCVAPLFLTQLPKRDTRLPCRNLHLQFPTNQHSFSSP